MATSTIPLAKGYDLDKMSWPALLSVKYDGVPVKLTVRKEECSLTWEVVSRSGKPVPSVHPYCAEIAKRMNDLETVEYGTYVIVAEITHEFLHDFKDVSGVVRKKEPQPFLHWKVFDFDADYREPQPFDIRIMQAQALVYDLSLDYIKCVTQKNVENKEHADAMIAFFQERMPKAEGFIIVSADRTFKPNSRHWDYQKIVVDPTADLWVEGFEEALSAAGEPLGMVGRLQVRYKDTLIGVGPGKLTHKERIELWTQPFSPTIATIKYKRDDSYAALRQPTFQHWRPERTDTSV